MSRFLITGGAGFIGSHLCELLVAEGHEVVVLDNLSTGKRENLQSVEGQVRFLLGDVRDAKVLIPALEGVDKVIHLAAIPSVIQSIEEPMFTSDNNILGTISLFEGVAKHSSAKRIIQASSSAVYGDVQSVPCLETAERNPLSPYAIDKVVQELYGAFYGNQYGLEVVSLRFFNVYGTRQDPRSVYAGVIPIFMDKIRHGQQPIIYGDGNALRDYINVKDIAMGLYQAAMADTKGHLAVNLGTGIGTTVKELAGLVLDLFGSTLSVGYASRRTGEVEKSLAGVDLAEAHFGFKAGITLKDGLKELKEN